MIKHQWSLINNLNIFQNMKKKKKTPIFFFIFHLNIFQDMKKKIITSILATK